jgi:pyruvate dehydrogenase E2 component (dihydrolipoamide acetyltransferase)
MTTVTLPHLSLAMETGKVARWLVANGERVSAGQAIVEIETDKALAEVEAPASGIVRRMVDEGATVPVDAPLAEILDSTSPAITTTPVAAFASTVSTREELSGGPTNPPVGIPGTKSKHRGSPAARRIARERGFDLTRTHDRNSSGRITARDLERETQNLAPSIRESVTAQLAASWRSIPHIHVGGELDGTGLAAAKKAAPAGTTITDLLVFTLVRALLETPQLNGTVDGPAHDVHVALAVATHCGVLSPVIRNANRLSLVEIARERSRVVTGARAGIPDRRDLAGGTITLSNLGAHPVDFFTPIVSGPQVATLAVGRLTVRPAVINGAVAIRHSIWMNVAIDHRGADGVIGGRFLAALERCMSELPTRME